MSNINLRYYILISNLKNSEKSFDINTWGFSEKRKGSWNKSRVGELIAFYITDPIKKIVGFGVITDKVIEEDLIWPDEIFYQKSILKYRLKFSKIFLLEDYTNGITISQNLSFNDRTIISKKSFYELVAKSEEKWNYKFKDLFQDQTNPSQT